MIPIGRCCGDSQTSEQPEVPQATLMWPPRAFCAGAHSHGSQLISTAPGRHGWPRRQATGMTDQIAGLRGGTTKFKHVFERAEKPEVAQLHDREGFGVCHTPFSSRSWTEGRGNSDLGLNVDYSHRFSQRKMAYGTVYYVRN
ncbi:MAG TPA: hypothetical protein VMA32_00010 [Streptosporangiaceae bacterium]|nr:hypothetical protein [Streptosporangiaceae bacterium]